MAKAGMGHLRQGAFLFTQPAVTFRGKGYVMTKQQAVRLVHDHFDETVLSVQMTDAFVKLFELLEDKNEHNTNA